MKYMVYLLFIRLIFVRLIDSQMHGLYGLESFIHGSRLLSAIVITATTIYLS